MVVKRSVIATMEMEIPNTYQENGEKRCDRDTVARYEQRTDDRTEIEIDRADRHQTPEANEMRWASMASARLLLYIMCFAWRTMFIQ